MFVVMEGFFTKRFYYWAANNNGKNNFCWCRLLCQRQVIQVAKVRG